MRVLYLILTVLVLNCLPESGAAQTTDAGAGISTDRSSANRDNHPITDTQRLTWFVNTTIGPKSLAAGVFSAGFGSALNNPEEYGPHWGGFGKRYAMRLT